MEGQSEEPKGMVELRPAALVEALAVHIVEAAAVHIAGVAAAHIAEEDNSAEVYAAARSLKSIQAQAQQP